MSRAQLKPLTDIVELDRESSVDIDPAFLKPEDFCDVRNGGGQKYQVKKAEVERMIDFAEKKKKLKNEGKVGGRRKRRSRALMEKTGPLRGKGGWRDAKRGGQDR